MKSNYSLPVRIFSTVVLTAGLLVSMCGTVFADTTDDTESTPAVGEGLVMSTDYPGVYVKAGESVSFALDFANGDAGQNVSLSASDLPDGFTGYFQGGGNTITNVFVQNGFNSELVTYTVDIPEDATEGDYTITLDAKGTTGSSSLTLTLTISAENYGGSKITTDYSDQQGTSDTSFSFNATVVNNSTVDQSFSLSAEAPEGWTVSFAPSDESTSISSVDVEAGSSEGITVSVTPASDADAGDYEIPITATSANEEISTTLKCTITGTYGVTITTKDGTLSFDARSNKRSSVVLSITNSGNVDLTNINLTSSAPTDWTVEFSESTIDSLAAGATKEVTAYVTPANTAISGDYTMTITATSEETSSDAEFRVTVKTGTGWGIVGLVIIAAIIAALVVIFRKFGRH